MKWKDLEWNDKLTYEVPNVVGLSVSDAKKVLFNFDVKIIGTGDIIYEQSPKAGEVIEDGSRIRIFIN